MKVASYLAKLRSMAREYSTFDAKSNLSEILREVEKGEDVIITRLGRAVAKVIPINSASGKKRRLGFAKGEFAILPGFDEPVTAEELLGDR